MQPCRLVPVTTESGELRSGRLLLLNIPNLIMKAHAERKTTDCYCTVTLIGEEGLGT